MKTFNQLKSSIIYFSPIALCFDAYAFFYFGTFPVTLSFICLFAILLIGIIQNVIAVSTFSVKQFLIGLLLLLLIIFSILFSGFAKLNSFSLYVFFFAVFFASGYSTTKDKFYRKIKLAWVIYTVFSAYGIYQFFAYLLNLPFQEILISGHMVVGFNRTNFVQIGSFMAKRAHSIYLEPSTLSQFSVCSIIFAGILYKNKKIGNGKTFVSVIINLLALIFSVAGTGFLILMAVFAYFCVRYFVKHGWNKYVIVGIFIILASVLGICFLDSPITNYVRARISEVLSPQWSGGMRFTFPYYIMMDVWSTHLFGYSPGNELQAIQNYFGSIGQSPTFSTVASGYAKIGIDLGIFGLILLFVLMSTLNKKSIECRYIFIFVLCINFVGGNLLQCYFWVYMALLNVKFVTASQCQKISNCSMNSVIHTRKTVKGS